MTRIPINDDQEQPTPQPPEGLEPELDTPAGGEATAGAAGRPPGAADEQKRLQEERDALFDRLARATADFKNAQKRMEADADQRVQYANSALIKSLLPVIDNFERALAVDPAKTDVAALLKGMQIVHDQWLKVLKDQKVEEIAPEAGTPFDPTKHEAMMQQEADYAEPTVLQVLQKGYALHGRTLRPAQVIVSRST